MDNSKIREAIRQKYIAPTGRKAKDYVGTEFELPIVNLNREAVDFSVIHRLAEAFAAQFGFNELMRDDEGNIYSALKQENGDDLSFDCSYNTLELSMGRTIDMNRIYARFSEYYAFIQAFLATYRHTLTGMGVNPYRTYNLNIPVPTERYRMLLHHLKSYTGYEGGFHDHPEFGLFSAANQVQLDVESADITDVIRVFNKLEPLKSLLFANSPLDGFLLSRDYLWADSLHGLNPRNVGGYDEAPDDIDDVVSYIEGMSLYCVMRDGRYINFRPVPLDEYFSSPSITGDVWNGKAYESVSFTPQLSDLDYLRSFKFEDLTFRGTIEFRSVCEQPVSEIMASPALHTGLMRRTHELADLLDSDRTVYQNGHSEAELRSMFNRGMIPENIHEDALKALLVQVIELAEDGLRERGAGEEHFLTPLYSRARSMLSPAKEMTDGISAGIPLEHYIEEYAALSSSSISLI